MSFGRGKLSSGGRQQLEERWQEVRVWVWMVQSPRPVAAALCLMGRRSGWALLSLLDLWSGSFEEHFHDLSAGSKKKVKFGFLPLVF